MSLGRGSKDCVAQATAPSVRFSLFRATEIAPEVVEVIPSRSVILLSVLLQRVSLQAPRPKILNGQERQRTIQRWQLLRADAGFRSLDMLFQARQIRTGFSCGNGPVFS